MPPPTTFQLTKALSSAGFQSQDSHTIVERMCIASSGHEKHGKTRFASTLPGTDLAALSNDPGTKDVLIPSARALGKRVHLNEFATSEQLREMAKDQNRAKKEWRRANDAAKAIADTAAIRSVYIDTGGGFWELCRLAILGKLTKIMPHQYAEANNAMEEFFMTMFDRPDLNILISHKLKKKYIGSEWDGKSYAPAAYEGMKYLVDINIEHTRGLTPATNQLIFGVRVIDSRHNALGCIGQHLTTRMPGETAGEYFDDCTVPGLAAYVWPDTPAEVWD